MKKQLFALAILLSGVLMGGAFKQFPSEGWVTIEDEETGLKVNLPEQPSELTFETPFQNTPSTGEIHFFTAPTESGIFVLARYASDEVNPNWLQKETFYQWFETLLVPHFFFHPEVVDDHQVFNYRQIEIDRHPAASFQLTFQERGVNKHLDGDAIVIDHSVYAYFYLASKKDFDKKLFDQFINSIHF